MKLLESALTRIEKLLHGGVNVQSVRHENPLIRKIGFVDENGKFAFTEYETALDGRRITADLERKEIKVLGVIDKNIATRFDLIDS